MLIRGWGTYVSSWSTTSALVSSNRNSVCAYQDCSTRQMKAWQEEMIVRCTSKTLSQSTPKTNVNAPTDFPDAYSYILTQYLCRSWYINDSSRNINHQVPHLMNPGGLLAHSEKCISPHVVQGSQRVHKAQISHEKQCKPAKALSCNPL